MCLARQHRNLVVVHMYVHCTAQVYKSHVHCMVSLDLEAAASVGAAKAAAISMHFAGYIYKVLRLQP